MRCSKIYVGRFSVGIMPEYVQGYSKEAEVIYEKLFPV